VAETARLISSILGLGKSKAATSWADEYLVRHRPSSLPEPAPGCYVNWLGIQTEANLFPMAGLAGSTRSRFPDPNDGVYGTDIEYASALMAVEQRGNRERFVAVELGAGWGPWVTASGVAAKRLGVNDIKLVGVEAHAGRCAAMSRQFQRNGLGDSGRVLEAAAWPRNERVRFGTVDPHTDQGGAATTGTASTDYRGMDAAFVEVDGLDLPTICEGLEHIDYMHWDIQGAELENARAFIDYLDQHVRYVFIGTHSMAIHGNLIELFYQHRWVQLHQNPPKYHYNRDVPSLEGMTTTDGEVFFANQDLMVRMTG
jgi:FkbM family methyltransferase